MRGGSESDNGGLKYATLSKACGTHEALRMSLPASKVVCCIWGFHSVLPV